MILKLADQRKDTIKPLSLTKNYRSHSGVLEFAATFLTQLDVCFPDSFQKLDADFGLSRGPRPGCWTAPKGMASLRAALKLDQRLIVLTRDGIGHLRIERSRVQRCDFGGFLLDCAEAFAGSMEQASQPQGRYR